MARPDPGGGRGDGRAAVHRPDQRRLRALPAAAELPGPRLDGRDHDRRAPTSARYSPAELASALGLFPPTAEQAAVIAAPPGPLVVIAGAGAGKTETMAARVVWLVANGYAEPGQVLGLTFTRKAAGQLLRRVRSRLARLAGIGLAAGGRRSPVGEPDGAPVVSTYHAFAGLAAARIRAAVLPDRAGHPAAQRDRALAAGLRRRQRLRRRAAHRQDPGRGHRDGAAAVGSARRAPGRHRPASRYPCRARAAGAHLARGPLPARPRPQPVAAAHAGHPGRARRAGAAARRAAPADARGEGDGLRHADGLGRAAGLGVPAGRRAAAQPLPGGAARRIPGHRTRPAHRVVVAVRRRRRRRTGVDRRRRPDPVDLRLARRLGDQPAAVHHRLPAVRRHARAGSGAADQLAQPAARPCTWPTPSRRRRDDDRLRCTRCARARTPRPAPSAARCCPTCRPNASGSPITCTRATSRRAPTGVSPPTAAVLVRRNADAAPIADALRARGIPVEVVGLAGLLSVPEVADVVAMLRLVADPTAGAAAMRVLTGPRWRLGARDIAALWRRAVATGRRAGRRDRRTAESIADGRRAGRRHRVPGRRDRRSRPGRCVFGCGISAHRRAGRRAERAARPPRSSAARPGRRGAPRAGRRLRGPGRSWRPPRAGRAPSTSTRSPTWSPATPSGPPAVDRPRHRPSWACWPTWTRPRSSRTACAPAQSSSPRTGCRCSPCTPPRVWSGRWWRWRTCRAEYSRRPRRAAAGSPTPPTCRRCCAATAPRRAHWRAGAGHLGCDQPKAAVGQDLRASSPARSAPRRRGAQAAVRGDHPGRGHPAVVRPSLGCHRDQAARPVGFPVRTQGHHRPVGRGRRALRCGGAVGARARRRRAKPVARQRRRGDLARRSAGARAAAMSNAGRRWWPRPWRPAAADRPRDADVDGWAADVDALLAERARAAPARRPRCPANCRSAAWWTWPATRPARRSG